MKKDYYSFVYLDNEVIEDLYPQIFGDIIEKKISNIKETSTENTLNGNLANIVGISKDGAENNMISEDIKLVSSVSRKAQLLINHFKTDITSLQDIIRQNEPFEEGIICVGKATFALKDIYSRKTHFSIFPEYRNRDYIAGREYYIEPDGDSIFKLESGDTFGDYLNPNIPPAIMMNVSNYKMKKDIHHLTEMIRLKRKFIFYVFGELNITDGHYYILSPYAIWQ